MEQQQADGHGGPGRYELLERLGHGGMGEVWKARDTQLQRYVALKFLQSELQDDSDFAAYFMREARLIAALRHPNIVQIHDFQPGSTQGQRARAYMVMDYIEGGTLADVLNETVRRGVFWPANEIIDLFTAISLALDYAHAQGMIHRDIKPANILLDRTLAAGRRPGTPVLTDFGIARWQGSGSTLTGFIGTPLYISPEQAQSAPVDARSDLYSLGIVLYEVLTGRTPFQGNNPLAVMLQHVEQQPPQPASINPFITPALSAVILKSIAKDPRERFPSATAMTIALAHAFALPVPAVLDQAQAEHLSAQDYNPLQPSTLTPAPSAFEPGMAPMGGNSAPAVQHMLPNRDATLLTPVRSSSSPPSSQGGPLAGGHAPGARHGGDGAGAEQRRGIFARRWVLALVLICLLLLVVPGAVLVPRLFTSSGQGTPSASAGGQKVGTLRFLSSASAAYGVFDQVQIDMQPVPSAPAGKVYYAWLTQQDSEAPSLPHWVLQVKNGAIHGVYTSSAPGANLLSKSNRLLITTEDATSSPVVPYASLSGHLYYAQIDEHATTTPSFEIKTCPTGNLDSSNNPCL